MKVSDNVLEVLGRSSMNGTNLLLPPALDRKAYVDVNKVLVAAGEKWNRKAGAHVFGDEAAEAIEPILFSFPTNWQEFEPFDGYAIESSTPNATSMPSTPPTG